MDEPRAGPPGAGWRAAAWLSLTAGAIIAVPALSYRSPQSGPDLIRLIGFVIGVVLAFGFGILGTVCGIAGASKAAGARDKRLAVVLPMWCSLAFLLVLAGCIAAGRR